MTVSRFNLPVGFVQNETIPQSNQHRNSIVHENRTEGVYAKINERVPVSEFLEGIKLEVAPPSNISSFFNWGGCYNYDNSGKSSDPRANEWAQDLN